MRIKKYVSIAAILATLGSFALVIPAFAQQGSTGGMPGQGRMYGGQAPAVVGTVSAISGSTVTVTSKMPSSGGSSTTYSVDASSATVTKSGAASSVSSIAVGDTVAVQGTVSGTNVTATTIRDGVMPGVPRGAMHGMPGVPKPGSRPGAMGMGIRGTVATISGNTLTVTGKQGFSSTTATTTYTVDATNATITKNGATSTVASIAVGDTVSVQGTVSGSNVTAKTILDGVVPSPIQGNGEPVVAGSITSISGNTITITNKSNVTYTVDATNAKFIVPGVSTPTISSLSTGDNLVIQGTVNGTSVTASSVIDQKAPASNSSSGSNAPHPKAMGGIGGIFGGIGNFFKHIFGF